MTNRPGFFGLAIAAVLAVQLLPVSAPEAQPSSHDVVRRNHPDRVIQIAPLERLAQGGYDGTTTVWQAKQSANFGIGTFNGLDGELIMLDGVVYQAPSNGVLREATSRELIPFATLAQFRMEYSFIRNEPLADYAALQAFLNSSMPNQSQVVAIKVRGTFTKLKIRSPQKQVKPYPVLTEALKTQAVFNLTDVAGTLVGFRHPAYFGTVNAAGYHFHFISDDRTIGGHVLEIATTQITADMETVEQYDVTLGESD